MNKPVFIELTQQGTGKRISVNPAMIEMVTQEESESLRNILWLSIGGTWCPFSESKAQLLQMIDRAYQEGGEK